MLQQHSIVNWQWREALYVGVVIALNDPPRSDEQLQSPTRASSTMTPHYSGSMLAAACHPSRVRALLANPNIPLNHAHCPYGFICLHLLCFREQQRCPSYIEQAWIASECVVEDTRLRNVFQSTHFLRDCEALAARSPPPRCLAEQLIQSPAPQRALSRIPQPQ